MTTLKRANHGAEMLVRRLWQYCNILRDDGLSYPDYVEQLTYLLFLKMSDEQEVDGIPIELGWSSFKDLDAAALSRRYARSLKELGKSEGMLGLIFRNARNKIRDPAKLRLLVVDLIGQTEWSDLSVDLKGDAYEGLLEKNARDTKSGAGQYFTPRPLIEAIVECVDPQLGEVVCDPACGTAGFLLAAYDHVVHSNPDISHDELAELATRCIRGVELVEEVARLAAMNLLLHGVGSDSEGELPIACRDSLNNPPETTVDVVLTNPPFGIKGSVPYVRGEGPSPTDDPLRIVRPDFRVQTSNKQLNFLQHVLSLLKPSGRGAVVVPDNVLFEGGAAAQVRRTLLEECRLHTLLRLPAGIFYAQGVQANVIFFDRCLSKTEESGSRVVCVYDLRSDKRFSLKVNPLKRDDLEEFVVLVRDGFSSSALSVNSSRARCFSVAEILATDDCRLDLAWEDDDTAVRMSGLARLDELSRLITDDLQRALSLINRSLD